MQSIIIQREKKLINKPIIYSILNPNYLIMKDIMSLLCTARRFAMGGSKRLLVALVCILSLTVAYAQDVTISGTVVDDIGEPLIGATVMVDGTKIAVATDIDGNFSIKVPAGKNSASLM